MGAAQKGAEGSQTQLIMQNRNAMRSAFASGANAPRGTDDGFRIHNFIIATCFLVHLKADESEARNANAVMLAFALFDSRQPHTTCGENKRNARKK